MTLKDKEVKMVVICVGLEEVLSEKKTKFPGKTEETPQVHLKEESLHPILPYPTPSNTFPRNFLRHPCMLAGG